MTGLIDFHSHFFSRPFFETLAAASPLPGTVPEKMEWVASSAGLELPPENVAEHLTRWRAEMDRHGLEHLVTFASVPEEADALGQAMALSEGRLSGLMMVHPGQAGAPEHLARRMDDEGFCGALVFPAMHRFALDGPEFAALLRVLDERAGLVVVHCGLLRIGLRDRFRLPRGYDLRLADPLALAAVADAFPAVRFVIPHFGAGFFRETLFAGAQCPNVYVDTSSSNDWRGQLPQPLSLVDLFERTLEVFGPERVLFGTDSSVFPRGWRRDVWLAQREALGATGVSAKDQARIFGENAQRLLRRS